MKATYLFFFGALVPAFASSIYDTTILSNNPALFLPLNETSGTTAANLSTASGAQNGTYNNVTPGFPGGPDGHGATFTPIGTNVSIPNYSAVDVTSQFSIETWVDVPSAGANAYGVIFAINRALNSTGLALALNGDHPELALNNGANFSEISTGSVINGQWNQIDVVWNEGAPSFYINGVLTGNADAGTFTTALNLSTTLPVSIGAEFPNLNTASGRWFSGDIEDVSLFRTALNAGQVAADYQAGTPEPGSLLLIGVGLIALVYGQIRLRRGAFKVV